MIEIRNVLDDAFADGPRKPSVVKPYVLSHGTLESRDLYHSRRFYEQFLGLECVQHSPVSMAVRCGLKFHVICVERGEALRPVSYLNHWGVDVSSREEVDAAHAAALAEGMQTFGIRQVKDVVEQHGVYSFYFEDLDYNWWEIQYYEPGYQHTDIFEFGDVFDTSLVPRGADGKAP